MTNLDKTDAVAASLAKTYKAQGEFCVIVRTDRDNKNLRLIYPHIDVTLVSALLDQASESLFNGNVRAHAPSVNGQ